jgi:hypothetical protein
MSRPSKGARLYLRSERRDKRGRVKERATWIIRDGSRDVFTGCAQAEIDAAEQKLREYLASKYSPKRKIQDIETIPIADVLPDRQAFAAARTDRRPPSLTNA